jgi:hypothetical protein
MRVFEKGVLREIFGANREEVTRDWRKLNNEELHKLYCSPDIIYVTKLRTMRWAGHMARTGGEKKGI